MRSATVILRAETVVRCSMSYGAVRAKVRGAKAPSSGLPGLVSSGKCRSDFRRYSW